MTPHPFRVAVEARDHAAMVAALAPEVVFLSPVTFRPIRGRDAVGRLFAALLQSFDRFDYVEQVEQGPRLWLRFEARVGDKDVDGVDLLGRGADGLIENFTVMVRPLSAVVALAERVAEKLGEGANDGPQSLVAAD